MKIETIKTCNNCEYRSGTYEWGGRCLATGRYMTSERRYSQACGPEFKIWRRRQSFLVRLLARIFSA